MTDALNAERLENALRGLPIPRIIFYEETDSTNEQGLKLAAQGAAEFTLLIAERQTAGRGRLGRKWVTAPGTSLAFSMIFQPKQEEITRLGLFSLLGGLAVCRAIQETTGIQAQVKWPNDVLLDNQKTAGILAEMSWQGEKMNGLVLGIGINLLPGSVPPPGEVLFPATCLQAHTPIAVERLAFLRAALEQLIQLRPRILEDEFLEDYSKRMAFVGRRVNLSSGQGEQVSGVVLGVKVDGQLRLRLANGKEAGFPIGELRLRPEDQIPGFTSHTPL